MVFAVFVDGLGLGENDPARNPLVHKGLKALPELLACATPVDACLGVPGLPQSATGQVTLFTGVNAAREMGRHLPGFPPPTLRRLIVRGTFYSRLLTRGHRAAFLNAFSLTYLRRMAAGSGPVSCTTLAAAASGVRLRDAADVRKGRAVYHDLTGDTLRERGERVPAFTPEEAAEVALGVAREHDLTLFEYFLTDRAGHFQDPAAAYAALLQLDAFLDAVIEDLKTPSSAGQLSYLVLMSDHGNIEDLSCRTHTANPVPLSVLEPRREDDPCSQVAALARDCVSLADVAGFLVALAGGSDVTRSQRA